MNTANKIYPDPTALQIEPVVLDLVQSFSLKRKGILNRYRVSELELRIVRYLNDHEQQKMKQVGDYFNIKLSTLTSLVDKLEDNKLVRRRHSREDRRVIFLEVTARGKSLLNDIVSFSQEVTNTAVAEMNAQEAQALSSGLRILLTTLKNY